MILAGALEYHYIQIFFIDRVALDRRIADLRFGKMPEISPFLHEVERHTEPGQKIALVIPSRKWHEGYEYAFLRAAYVLAGRTVLPVVWTDDRFISKNLRSADLVAAWHVEMNPGRFTVVWRGAGGALYRERR